MEKETHKKAGKTQIAFWALAAIAAGLAGYMYIQNMPPPFGKYDAFARCIANTSTTFYGAFWCPHCEAQKNMFGDASKYLPYVECSTPDASGETAACKAAGITEYPTWYYPDGSSSTGDQSLATISAKTGCPLPTSS